MSQMELPHPLSHAYIITGGNSAQREEYARRLTMAYVCEGVSSPCGRCRHCEKAAAGIHPDVSVMTPLEGKREIVSDAMTKASIDFVNEFAGAEKYLRKSGLSREDAETVSQFMRSASARADAAVSMYQYDLAGLDSAVNVSGSSRGSLENVII